ncbi:MAG TPA: hypothetical protein VFW78_00755 [Bacteroidia bacterium]|nr:hypothetical protein [Bacteroidia bacterium]
MLDRIKDIANTIYERLNSPFIGSFMITWSIWHWKIFAFLFYNENGLSISERVELIDNYLSNQTLFSMIWLPILTTFLVLILYNVFNAVALGIKLIYTELASPYIQHIVNNKLIVSKERFNKLKSDLAELRDEYDEEKEKYLKTQNEMTRLIGEFEKVRNQSVRFDSFNDLTHIWNQNGTWQMIEKFGTQNETITEIAITHDGIKLGDRTLKIKSIRQSADRKILHFQKEIGSKIIDCDLLNLYNNDYLSVEDKKQIVLYKQILNYKTV